jgi:hypothetical protein
MSTTGGDWTENQEHHASSVISATGNAQDTIDLDASNYDEVEVFISIAFGSTPDGDCVVEVFPSYDSGTTFTTKATYTRTIERQTSTTVIVSFIVSHAAARIKVTNNDSTDSVTYVGKYTGKKYNTV